METTFRTSSSYTAGTADIGEKKDAGMKRRGPLVSHIAATVLATWTPVMASSVPVMHINTITQMPGKTCCPNSNTTSFDCIFELPKPDYRARYKKIAKADWYNKAYSGKSIGEVIEIVD